MSTSPIQEGPQIQTGFDTPRIKSFLKLKQKVTLFLLKLHSTSADSEVAFLKFSISFHGTWLWEQTWKWAWWKCWNAAGSLDLQSFGVESSSELSGKESSAQDLLVLLGLSRDWGSAKQEPTFNLHSWLLFSCQDYSRSSQPPDPVPKGAFWAEEGKYLTPLAGTLEWEQNHYQEQHFCLIANLLAKK